jgi:hypothetical protein
MSQLPIIIDTHDGEFAFGSIGLAVNGVPGALFDKVRLEPIDCFDVANETSTNLFVPPWCSRYRESFMAEFSV